MVFYSNIELLENLVNEFLDKETNNNESDSAFMRRLDRTYNASTKAIIKNLEDYCDDYLQEDCDLTAMAFRNQLREVQERADSLKSQFQKATAVPTNGNDERMKIQASFCERMIVFINSLIDKVEEMKETALSGKESDDVFFVDVRVEEKDLFRIYDNLVHQGWIIGSFTSLNDFCHIFTGNGFRPRKPVRWNKTEDELCLFIEAMTFDIKDLTKTAKLFVKQKETGIQRYDRRQLSASRSRINNQRPIDKRLKLESMYRDIFNYPDWKELAKSQSLF